LKYSLFQLHQSLAKEGKISLRVGIHAGEGEEEIYLFAPLIPWQMIGLTVLDRTKK